MLLGVLATASTMTSLCGMLIDCDWLHFKQ